MRRTRTDSGYCRGEITEDIRYSTIKWRFEKLLAIGQSSHLVYADITGVHGILSRIYITGPPHHCMYIIGPPRCLISSGDAVVYEYAIQGCPVFALTGHAPQVIYR